MKSPPTNDITLKQTLPDSVSLLRARYRTYHAAKATQAGLILLTIALPVVSVLLASHFAEIKPYLALAALVLLMLDTAIIERLQKDRVKRGAKLQEEFDTTVFGLPWNRFVAGTIVDHEDVRAASTKLLSPKRESELATWYEPCVEEVPLQFGRLVCQRTNISYDGRLRKKYGNALLYGAIVLGIGLLLMGLSFDLNMSELLLNVVVPFTPILNWTLREFRKQVDTANALTTLKIEFEKIWDRAIAGAAPGDLDESSRQLQDAIYQHRASSPLVFDWVYDRFRTGNEDEARHAAQRLVQQAKLTLTEQTETL